MPDHFPYAIEGFDELSRAITLLACLAEVRLATAAFAEIVRTRQDRVLRLRHSPRPGQGTPDLRELGFALELWGADDLHVERLLGRFVSILPAMAAFEVAAEVCSGPPLRIRQGVRVVRQSRQLT